VYTNNNEVYDMVSYYVMGYKKRDNNTDHIQVGNLFYYTTFRTSILKLITDILVVSKNRSIDLMSASDIMENDIILRDLLFEKSNRELKYYMYNYKCKNLMNIQIGKLFF
jgi:hypothetical protein